MSKLILIDGNAILHRAYHALPKSLTTKEGEPINAVYGFVSMLLRIIQDLEPTHLAVAFDRKEPTFRKEKFEEYQAHRPEMDEELVSQFDKTKKILTAMGIPVYSKVGFEADDVIGTLSRKASKDDFQEIDIVTGDRDILQLVDDKVKVYLPVRGLSEGKLFGEREVVEKMGVKPKQIVDYKGLVGDPSDNYKGVAGIGPKTAENLLEEYGSFEKIYENLDKLPKNLKEKLEKDRESAETSYMLAKIVTDVDVDLDRKGMGKWNVKDKKLLDVFGNFGFKTLTKRVKDVGKTLEEKKQGSLF
jgi:DNA polymerase-1